MGPASAWPIATSQATGSPMSTARMRSAPTTVTSTAPAIASSRRLVPSQVSPMPTLRPMTAWPMT